jgi:hypothetical protein
VKASGHSSMPVFTTVFTIYYSIVCSTITVAA